MSNIVNNVMDIPIMNIEEMVSLASKEYIACYREDGNFINAPSLMLWGPPGVGKSDGLAELGNVVAKELGKVKNLTDVRLVLMNPVDLMGVPYADLEKQMTIWLKPYILDMDDSADVVNILLFDEISQAVPSVQACAYQITLDRKIGPHKIPDNCIILCAGNRTTDKSVAYKMPKALCNRLMHFEITADFESWKAWAIRNNIEPSIIAYLSFKPNHLFDFNSNSDSVAYATPRSWAAASRRIKHHGLAGAYKLIAGTVGLSMAMDFKTYTRVYDRMPSIEAIMNGDNIPVPVDPDMRFAVCMNIVTNGIKLVDVDDRGMLVRVDKEKLTNLAKYINKFDADCAVKTVTDLFRAKKGMSSALLKIPEFHKWQIEIGKYL